MTESGGPVDNRTTGESPHALLLAMAGRVDDDLLAWCRELVAVGEDTRAVELITATLVADRTSLPTSLRSALVGATQAARSDLHADSALAPGVDEHDTAHRFGTDLPGAQDLAAAVGALPTRQISGCRSWATLRTTPAGSAPGPLPHPVVLVEVGADDTRPVDIMAYQLAIACARTGAPAAVEVLVAGTPLPAYHEAALRSAIPVHGADEPADAEPSAYEEPVVGADDFVPTLLSPGSPLPMLADTGPVPVEPITEDLPSSHPVPVAGPALPFESDARSSEADPLDDRPYGDRPLDGDLLDPARVAAAPESHHSSSDPSINVPSDPGPTDPDTSPFEVSPVDTSPFASSEADTADPDSSGTDASGPGVPLPRRPRPVTALRGLAPRPSPGRPPSTPSPGRRGNLAPVDDAALPADEDSQPADTPAFASLGNPLEGPIEDRPVPLDDEGEPMIDDRDPLGLGLMPIPAPEEPEPAAPPVPDTWLADWITGDWAMSPSALDGPLPSDGPAETEPPVDDDSAAVLDGPQTAQPDTEARSGRRRAGPTGRPFPGVGTDRADDADPEAGPEQTWLEQTGREQAGREQTGPEQTGPEQAGLEQTGFVLRPESVARLSEADRELLARLQTELAESPRPWTTHRAGVAGSNGTTPGSSPAAPPDMAG